MQRGHFGLALLGTCLRLFAQVPSDGESSPTTLPAWANEETVRSMCDAKIRWYFDRLDKAYQFTPKQREQVTALLNELKEEQIPITIATAQERMEIAGKLRAHMEAVRGHRRPQDVLPEDFWALKRRIREINASGPLFYSENVLSKIEGLLPEMQVTVGRARSAIETQALYLGPTVMFRDGEGAGRLVGVDDGWLEFVKRFCEVFDLDEAQQASAFSILRELLLRRDEHLSRHADFMDRLMSGEPMEKEVAELLKSLWSELRARLDRIPLDSQVAVVRNASPRRNTATRPSDFVAWERPTAASRPSATTQNPSMAPQGTPTKPSASSRPAR